jgi:flagellar basal-body rod protein FlgC
MPLDFTTALDIAASGLSAQRINLNVISMNLANINTTRTQEGGPYRRKEVIFQSAPIKWPFDNLMRTELERQVKGVKVNRIVEDNRPFRRVYDPGHPDADKDGYVLYPDINVVEEMANMLTSLRSYEANLSTISSIKSMLNQALEIAR